MKMIDAGSSGEWGWHATELAMKCPQAFAYNYRVKWPGDQKPETGKKPALVKGSLIHQGLAHYYARLRDGADAWASPEDAIDWEAEHKFGGDTEFVPLAKAAVRAYAAHYALDDLRPLHIEEVFKADVGGYNFTQRLDLVARDAAGRVIIIDHKTSSMLTKDTASRYTLSGQFLGMANFGREIWGKEFGGVMVNLIAMMDRNGVADFMFKRVPVEPAPNAMRLFPITVEHARRRIDELDNVGLNPMEWPKVLSETVCTNTYGRCEWYELCRWGK